ncbi:hypothetical protein T07_6577 [Trichinella nelsoni]|uniref:Uncharacterized protein n=1 Tax=Trichinella nelsoni TaxID=6336 RepID=A0A0V0RBF9_9BILA|nr:hypothetical protein T07_6577 [Trichinella nelsoni]
MVAFLTYYLLWGHGAFLTYFLYVKILGSKGGFDLLFHL